MIFFLFAFFLFCYFLLIYPHLSHLRRLAGYVTSGCPVNFIWLIHILPYWYMYRRCLCNTVPCISTRVVLSPLNFNGLESIILFQHSSLLVHLRYKYVFHFIGFYSFIRKFARVCGILKTIIWQKMMITKYVIISQWFLFSIST